MKKIISIILILSMLILSGCTEKSDLQVNSETILNEYLKNVDSFEIPVRQFGEPVRHIDMTDEMVIGILYPETGNEILNSLIKDWVKETEEYYKNELPKKTDKKYLSELNASYESFIVNSSIVSVRMTGAFNSPSYVHPDDIVKTFNVDINSNDILKLEDFFTQDGIKLFKDIFFEKSEVKKESADEKIFDNFILNENGIEITLKRGDYLPMSDGTKTIKFTYEEINEFLKEPFYIITSVPVMETVSEADVSIKSEAKIETVRVENKKYIALTFDDGPSIHTQRLLDVFKKEGGKGTFFVVGNLIDRRPEILNRMCNEGHQIANHGWDHKQLTTLEKENIKDQIMMTRAKIYDVTGIDTLVMRPPYGSCNNIIKNVGEELGITYVNWSVDTLDWKTKNADSIYNEIMKNVKDGSVILCHDIFKTTVDAIERVVPKLISEGYELVTVSELFEINKKRPEPGKVYFRF